MEKSYAWLTADNARLVIEETPKRNRLVISIVRTDADGTPLFTRQCTVDRETADEIRNVLPGGYSMDRLQCEYPPNATNEHPSQNIAAAPEDEHVD